MHELNHIVLLGLLVQPVGNKRCRFSLGLLLQPNLTYSLLSGWEESQMKKITPFDKGKIFYSLYIFYTSLCI